MKIFFSLFVFFALNAHGFIPPVSSVLKQIFDSRKTGEILEYVFVHQVGNAAGGWSQVEERFILEPKGLKFLWKPLNSELFLSGVLEKRTYTVGTDKKIPARSLLFLKNFTAVSAFEFRDALINEKFLKWDQLKQFKDGFDPQGDPQSWDIKGNYLTHDSISLVLLPSGPSISVVGYQDQNSKRTVYFDKAGVGVSKIEWLDSSEVTSWTFDKLTLNLKEATFPKRATFIRGGRELIQSELVTVRILNRRQVADWLQSWQRAPKVLVNAPAAEEALIILLGNR
ncbi:hypothetical protein EBQ74_01410 [bacterium]|nr:hypothetical protein [bacterium]